MKIVAIGGTGLAGRTLAPALQDAGHQTVIAARSHGINMSGSNVVDTTVPPSGDGCVECLAIGSWWFHLRRCALCGHVGCCDSSLGRHATDHFHHTGHPVMQSFEPGEDWCWNYEAQQLVECPMLALPDSHPASQPTPGPAGSVPANWLKLVR